MNLRNLMLASTLWASVQVVLSAQTHIVPNTVAIGNSIAQYISGDSGLDGPKVSPEINATSFDWLYFDAVSEDSSMAIVIVFFLSTDLGFPFVLPLSALSVYISTTFEAGSTVLCRE
jgi:hypothetical protein